MMNMDQLFKALPRDIQWGILTEMVGSHVVRKGKLIQKMVIDDRHKMVKAIPRIFKCGIWLYKKDYNTVADVQMWGGSQLMFCQNPVNGEMGYTFRKRVKRTHSSMPKSWRSEYTPMNDSVVLPPFEKHSYPSYEDTDKKKEARYPTLKRLRPERPRSTSPIGPPPTYI
jgi:hypothetical protein